MLWVQCTCMSIASAMGTVYMYEYSKQKQLTRVELFERGHTIGLHYGMEPRGELVHPVVGGRSLKGGDLVHDCSDGTTNTLLRLKGFKNRYLVQQKLQMLDRSTCTCTLYVVQSGCTCTCTCTCTPNTKLTILIRAHHSPVKSCLDKL